MEQENIEQENMEQEIVEEEKDPTLKFIEAVKEHKCIWDMQSEEYYNRQMYRAAWRSLIPPSEDPMPEQPNNSQQKSEINVKVAELKKVWVELRDTYYKNEDPGKKYKDGLRFLHSVYQSRVPYLKRKNGTLIGSMVIQAGYLRCSKDSEMEAVLEFDEPSWDLMDLRTWTVLKTHIPRCKRTTNPAPEYEKAKYNKKSKICNMPDKDNVTGKETVTDKENESVKENATDTENATGKQTATGKENDTDKGNALGKENDTHKKNAIGKENDTDNENVTGKENSTDTENATSTENVTDKENATGKENTTDKEYSTDKENATGTEIATDKGNVTGTENVTDKNNVAGPKNVTNKENVPVKENVSDNENATDKQNSTDKKNTNDQGIATKEKKKGRDEHQLTILEKAMRLYELENPGVWSSDEDEADKALRTYVDNTSQTDETDEYPNMPPCVNA